MRARPLAIAVMGIALICLPGAAYGDSVPLGAASNYAVLFEGTGGNNLQITNVNINGNIGVGGTGVVQFNGPATINGQVDFSASAASQFHNNNGANVGPTAVDYSFTNVMSALATVNSLSTTLGAETGTNLAISGNQTINASSGTLGVVNGHQYRVFNITSYSEADGKVVTIVGDAAGDNVVFNFSPALGNVNSRAMCNSAASPTIKFSGTLTAAVRISTSIPTLPALAAWRFKESSSVQLTCFR